MIITDVGNAIRNVIPEQISAKFNVRFNDLWTQESLQNYIRKLIPSDFCIKFQSFGYPFIGASEDFITKLRNILYNELNTDIEIGTYGGNSDALALHKITDVVEIGTPLAQAHTVDEYIAIDDFNLLHSLYYSILKNF